MVARVIYGNIWCQKLKIKQVAGRPPPPLQRRPPLNRQSSPVQPTSTSTEATTSTVATMVDGDDGDIEALQKMQRIKVEI
ncbi:hypothetical protein E3N88_28284 [Mikania micrantha]|uniref:Uncharacterized protein n=1 Tax=Mikania micrantha TaxID=192012 RepID=A0A5N6MZ25_9ASTR|nr:hypothetical protein E3N88_28284 [Mikania micrantha]